jgi:hypothetical protein
LSPSLCELEGEHTCSDASLFLFLSHPANEKLGSSQRTTGLAKDSSCAYADLGPPHAKKVLELSQTPFYDIS